LPFVRKGLELYSLNLKYLRAGCSQNYSNPKRTNYGLRKLFNEEIGNFYWSLGISVNKSRRKGRAHMRYTCMSELKEVSWEYLKKKYILEDFGLDRKKIF
jgi:hypothetical protein